MTISNKEALASAVVDTISNLRIGWRGLKLETTDEGYVLIADRSMPHAEDTAKLIAPRLNAEIKYINLVPEQAL